MRFWAMHTSPTITSPLEEMRPLTLNEKTALAKALSQTLKDNAAQFKWLSPLRTAPRIMQSRLRSPKITARNGVTRISMEPVEVTIAELPWDFT
jgi:hypothetical protein